MLISAVEGAPFCFQNSCSGTSFDRKLCDAMSISQFPHHRIRMERIFNILQWDFRLEGRFAI